MTVLNARAIRDSAWNFLVTDPRAVAANQSDYARITSVSSATTHALEPGAPVASLWLATDKGWIASLGSHADPDAALVWLENFAAAWAPGTSIGPLPRSRSARSQIRTPALGLGLALATSDVGHLHPTQRTGWLVPPDVTRRVSERALSWLRANAATYYVRRGAWCTPVPEVPDPAILTEMVEEDTMLVGVERVGAQPGRRCSVDFDMEGRVGCQDVDLSSGPQATMDRLFECVTWCPDALDYAFVAWAHGGRSNPWWCDHMHYDLPGGLAEPDVRYHRRLLAEYVPDAFAGQVLTDAHLERAHSLDDWRIKKIASQRHWVTARDLEPWLVQPASHPDNEHRLNAPPPHLLERARSDFGSMILTRSVIDELDPW